MTIRALAAPAWASLALFIVYASSGTWAGDGPRIWAPTFVSWTDVAQNVLLYVPFGVLGVLTLRHRRNTLTLSIVEVAAITALFSLFVEVIQLYTVDRTASVTDVVMAVAGAAAGGTMAERAAVLADAAIDAVRPSGVLDAADTAVLVVLLAALAISAWWPFDPTLDVSTMAGRWRVIRQDPWQVEGLATAARALPFMLLSIVIAASAVRLRTLEAMLVAAAATLAVALVLDAGQLAMGSQPIGLAGLGAQAAGAMAGAALFAMARVPK